MVRKLDGVGRLTIPMEIRNKLHWEEKDSIKMEVKDNSLVLSKNQKMCSLCGTNPIDFKIEESGFCKSCLSKIEKAFFN